MMLIILTAQIREEVYYSLTTRRLFPEEQKGCRKGSRGTGESLYIDKHILNKSKTRRKYLAKAYVDYKKTYVIVLQSWIINCRKMYKISDEVINFIGKTMKTWKVELTAGERSLPSPSCSQFHFPVGPKRYIARRCTITVTIHNQQMYMDNIELFIKMKKNWKL